MFCATENFNVKTMKRLFLLLLLTSFYGIAQQQYVIEKDIHYYSDSLDKKDIYRDLYVLWIFITLKTLTILRQLFGFTEEDLQVGTKKSQRHC